jgi:gluconolactonase
VRLVATGLRFPEGPVACADGTLLVVEIEGESVTRVDPARGTVERLVHCPGGPNGLALGPDAQGYVCNNGGMSWRWRDGLLRPGPATAAYAGGSIDRVDLTRRNSVALYTHADETPLSAPNDLVFDGNGGFWFTDTGKDRGHSRDHGGVYYARADGSALAAVIYPLVTPNGIGLAPDGRELYVAETLTGRLWAWPVTAPGTLGRSGQGPRGARLVRGFGGYQLLDSLAVDAEGSIAVATLVTGAISVVAPDGRLLRQVHVPGDDPFVTNVCFGDAGERIAYVTSSGRGCLYALDWPCPGSRLAYSSGGRR